MGYLSSLICLLAHCIGDKPKALNAYSGFVRILGPLVIDDMSWNWPEGRESLSLCRRLCTHLSLLKYKHSS